MHFSVNSRSLLDNTLKPITWVSNVDVIFTVKEDQTIHNHVKLFLLRFLL